jgi:outer membrane protein assembly factor BamB
MRAAFRVWFVLSSVCLLSLSVFWAGSAGAAAGAADGKKADPLDWPMWRGPESNGISREKNLPATWSPDDDGENLIWKSDALGTRSTPVVLNGKLYTVCRNEPETTKEGEKVVCADAATGKILWENIHNLFLTDAPAERVGWSSVVGDPATGHIYLQGLCGVCKCINGETGKTIWEHSLSEEYGILSTYGGRTNFPIVFEDVVIVSGVMTGWDDYAIPAHRYVAFNKATGEAIWIQTTKVRPEDTTYSTPFLTVIDGQAAIVAGAGDGSVYAIQPRTGKIIWRFDASTRGINTPPIVMDGIVYGGHAEQMANDPSTLGAIFAFKATGSGDITNSKENLLWMVPRIAIGRSAPLLVDGRLYYIDDAAQMSIVDAKKGKEVGKFKLGRIMFGSSIYGDGKIYVGEIGKFYILEPDPKSAKGVKVLSQVRFSCEMIASPIISHGRVYIPTMDTLYCIGLKDAKPTADPQPAALKEADAKADQKVAQVQITPVEALIHPGEPLRLNVKLFNAKGQLVATPATPKFTVEGVGSVNDAGEFSAPKDAAHVAAKITAEVDGVKSTMARVRVVPPLPWKFDISDKQVPVTWIGARYRHQVREIESNPALVKITTIPKGTRSQSWMGQPSLHDYTIQSDFKVSIKDGKQPDVGVINQRYTLALMGAHQKLQIRSWTARVELRFARTIKFAWEANKWYTMKFQSENKEGRVILRGKVWPKGEPEPSDWTIEAADLTPNTIGSPGLFGNASDAEILIDNIEVTPNK